jgi:HEAT repeat protein
MKYDLSGILLGELYPLKGFFHNGVFYRERPSGIHVPISNEVEPPFGPFITTPKKSTSDALRVTENPEIYIKAITDEDIPYIDRLIIIDTVIKIRLLDAAPTLRETMLHDDNDDIRRISATGLGKFGAAEYADDLLYSLENEKSNYVRMGVIESLGKLREKRALGTLRGLFEEYRNKIKDSMSGDGILGHGYEQCSDILTAMIEIGGPLARQTIEEALNDSNEFVYQSALMALYRNKYKIE